MIIADTGAVLALLDRSDRHHRSLRHLFEARPDAWRLPWAILPEVDYLALAHLGQGVEQAFLDDLATGGFTVEWGRESDLERARHLCARYRTLQIGLVDAVVIAVAERKHADAIATLDLRHFGAVRMKQRLKLLPRDL